ncbi:MAG: hypothetical protein LBQ22_09475 [Bacteroidales bacterium]|jgi:outer membrane protein assembly factor BamA|nr:hypothetical protein [Bacteroidales bacterium]
MIKYCKYFLVFIILLFNITAAYSQHLYLYTRESVLDDYRLEFSRKYDNNKTLSNFLENYSLRDYSRGYITSGFDSIANDTLSAVVNAYYTIGIKYRWNNISIYGIEQDRKMKIKEFSGEKNANTGNLQITFEKILKNRANNGYPFASVKLDSVTISDNGKIDGSLVVEQGRLYRFDSIILKGEAKIKPYYIQKYLGIKKGDIFSLSRANDISRRIKNLAFLDESRPFELAFADSTADVLLYLKNRKSSQFSGLLGILPNNQTTGKVLITGDVNLYLLNSLGFGELFSFNWQKFESHSQNLNVEISFPYLFKTEFGAGILFDIEKKDSSYVNIDFTGKILVGSNLGNGFDIYYRNTSSSLLSKASESITVNFSNNSVNMVGFSYRFSNLNDIFNPRSGIIIYSTSAFGSKNYELDIDGEKVKQKPIFQNRSKIDISGFIPVGRFMAIKLRSLTSMIYSKIIFNNELDLIGGLNTIRGFDELSIPVSSYSVASIEYRYLFEESSGLFLFFDAAYFEKRFTPDDNFNYGLGTGIGLDLKTPAGIFSLVFAIGKQNDNPFQFNNSKIHIGYKSYF